MAEAYVEPIRVIDQTNGFTAIQGVHETNQWRRVHLIIDRKGDHFRLKVQSDLFDSFEDVWEDDIPLTPQQLWGVVQQCRKEWHDAAVYFKRNDALLLQQRWD